MPATLLGQVHHYLDDNIVHVMAGIHTPVILTPTEVSRIQDHIAKRIGMPTELILHCLLSNNVSAKGSVKNIITPRLDGTFIKSSNNKTLNNIATAEQIIREYLSLDRALHLLRVEFLTMAERKIMLAHTMGIRQLSREETGLLENRIRKAVGDDAIELVIGTMQKTLKNTDGTIRYGWLLGNQATPEIRERVRQIRAVLSDAFDRHGAYELININATRLDDTLYFLLEITGPEVYPRQNIEKLEARLAGTFSEPIVLYAWSRIEVVQGPEGLMSMEKLRRYFNARQKENLPKEIPLLLEASGR